MEPEWKGLLPTKRRADKWECIQTGRNEELSQDRGSTIQTKWWRWKGMRQQNLEGGE